MSNLNFYHFCRVFAQVFSFELVDELFHNEAALVLDKEVFDSLLLITAKLVGEPEQLANCFLDCRIQIMIFIKLEERTLLVKLMILVELKFLETLVQKLEEHENSICIDEKL